MPRPLRLGSDGCIFHVTTRGNRRQPIFLDSGDRILFLRLLASTVARFGWLCQSYCLMGNHYHLVVQTPVFNLSAGMQRLNGRFAQLFNVYRGHVGHLFQGRFHSARIESDGHLLESLRYDALNPVRAGLVGDPGAWTWSSHRATAGLEPPPAFLACRRVWRYFHGDDEVARRAYRRFVDDFVVSGMSGV